MALLTVLFVVGFVVAVGLVSTVAFCTGIDEIRVSIDDFDRRIAEVAPYLGAAALFFVAKQATSEHSLQLSRALGWDITESLYAIEGTFVAHLQHVVPDVTYGLFSALYMFGFPYLLLVPLVIYFLLPSLRHLKEVLVAYVLNYTVGAICYTLFIAYGPRNWGPSHAEGAMYRLYPQTQELTAAVSSNTDVFPSLHTSLSIVVLLFAWRTRRAYPKWFYVATVIATGVVLSTMVVGIHWLSDVGAGVVLGAWSVVTASRIVSRVESGSDPAPVDDDGEGIGSNLGD